MLKDLNFVAFDFETTGINIDTDEPIQIWIIKFDKNFKIIDKFCSYIKPQKDIKDLKNIVAFITGINIQDLQKAKYFEDILPDIKHFFDENTVILGHNIKFDISFMKKYRDFPYFTEIDTFLLAKIIFHFLPSYALEIINEVIDDKNIEFIKRKQQELNITKTAHDAFFDSFGCIKIFYYFVSQTSKIIKEFPYILDFISRSESFYSKIFDTKASNQSINRQALNRYCLPALKKSIKNSKKIFVKDALEFANYKDKTKFFIWNMDLSTLLQRLVWWNEKIILSFASKSKMNIAKKLLSEAGISSIWYFTENLIFNQDNVKKFLSKNKYRDFELSFLIKYLSHHIDEIGILDLNCMEDFRVYDFLTETKEKTLPNIILSQHDSLFHSVKNKNLSTHKILFFDRDRWYQSFSKYINKTYDFYYLINDIEKLIYKKSFWKKWIKNLTNFYNFLLIFIWVLFGEITDKFKIYSVSRLEIWPMTNDIDFHKTNNMLWDFTTHLQNIKSELEDQEFQEFTKNLDEYLWLFDSMINISIKLYNNDDFYFVFNRQDNVINYQEFLSNFWENFVLFFTNSTTENSTKLDENATLSTSKNIFKISKLDKVIEHISQFENVFVLSTNKLKSNEFFEELVKQDFHKKYIILAENITWWVGKSLFYAKRKNKKIIIWWYEFLMSIFSEQIKLDNIVLYHRGWTMEKQIETDIAFY